MKKHLRLVSEDDRLPSEGNKYFSALLKNKELILSFKHFAIFDNYEKRYEPKDDDLFSIETYSLDYNGQRKFPMYIDLYEYFGFGDYIGGHLQQSNYEAMKILLLEKGFEPSTFRAGYDYASLLIPLTALNDKEINDTILELHRYAVIDDSLMSDLENDFIDESIEHDYEYYISNHDADYLLTMDEFREKFRDTYEVEGLGNYAFSRYVQDFTNSEEYQSLILSVDKDKNDLYISTLKEFKDTKKRETRKGLEKQKLNKTVRALKKKHNPSDDETKSIVLFSKVQKICSLLNLNGAELGIIIHGQKARVTIIMSDESSIPKDLEKEFIKLLNSLNKDEVNQLIKIYSQPVKQNNPLKKDLKHPMILGYNLKSEVVEIQFPKGEHSYHYHIDPVSKALLIEKPKGWEKKVISRVVKLANKNKT